MNIVKGSDNCSDWNNFKIKDVFLANEKSKVKASDSFSEGLFPFFNCSEKQTKFSNDYLVDGENIFISTGGDFMYTLYHKGRASYSTDVWSVKVLHCDTKFIGYKLKSNFEQNQTHFRGFKFKHLNKNSFKESSITVPSLYQQRQIVEILSKQESIINKTKELINELDKRNTFMLDELLSGRLRIKEENGAITFYKNPEDNWQSVIMNGEEKQIPKDWNIDLLSNRISFGMGSTPKKESDNYNGDLPWVTIANLKNKYLKSYTALIKRSIKNVKIIPKESLLGSFKMSVGRFSITTFDCATNEAIISISKKDTSFDLDYLYYYLPKIFKENATLNAQGIPLLNTKSIKKIQIIFSDKKNQENIAKFLSSLDSEKEKYEELLIEEQKKFDFLLEELMSGRLRIEE